MKIQHSRYVISAHFKILQCLNKGVVWELKSGKFIILSAFCGGSTLFVEERFPVRWKKAQYN